MKEERERRQATSYLLSPDYTPYTVVSYTNTNLFIPLGNHDHFIDEKKQVLRGSLKLTQNHRMKNRFRTPWNTHVKELSLCS